MSADKIEVQTLDHVLPDFPPIGRSGVMKTFCNAELEPPSERSETVGREGRPFRLSRNYSRCFLGFGASHEPVSHSETGSVWYLRVDGAWRPSVSIPAQ